MKFWKTRLPLLPIWPESVDLDGIKVRIRDSPLGAKMRRHIMRGGYETAERVLIKQCIVKGDCVLELGASIGIVTSCLWKQVGQFGAVISVEANELLEPPFFEQLKLNGFKGNWKFALCFPIWAKEVPECMKRQRFCVAESNLHSSVSQNESEGIKVPWKTALQLCSDCDIFPTALVIDVEGTESVWENVAPNFPQSVRCVIAEFHPSIYGAKVAGRCIQAVLDEGFKVTGQQSCVISFEREMA